MTIANSVKPLLVDIIFNDSDNKPLPTIFTAMPLYLGHLRSILPLPNIPTTERVMRQIAEGLHFMHSNLILHRDLKPANILVASPENIKIADYGWATSLKDTDSLYGVCGTVSYCAPEAFKRNEIHTAAIDVYSLGAIFYSMLDLDKVEHGWEERNFHGKIEVFNTTFENAFKNPPHRFGGLIQSMMAPNPEDRVSLDVCIEIVKGQHYDWTKKTNLGRVLIASPIPVVHYDTQRPADPAKQQQTHLDRARALAIKRKLAPIAQGWQPKIRQNPRQTSVKIDYRYQQDAILPLKPQAPSPQAVAVQAPKPSEPSPVQGVNFQDGLPSYEEAIGKNPFAKLVDSREIAKKRRRSKLSPPQNKADPAAEQRAKPVPGHPKKSKKKHMSITGVPPMSPMRSAVQPRVGATHSRRSASHSTSTTKTRSQHARNSRQAIRRPREHVQTLDIRRTGTGRIRKTTLTGIKAGAVEMGKGLYHFGRGLGAATCNIGCLTAEGIMMLYDLAARKNPAPNAGLLLNDDERQLVVNMRAQSLRRGAERQRPTNVNPDEKLEDVQRMALRGGAFCRGSRRE